MDEWLSIVIRQLTLYSLPVLVSLTLVVLLESRLSGRAVPHPFFAIAWRATWWPLLASLAFHRAVIIALPNPVSGGVKTATIRLVAHLLLCLLGFLLYGWSLTHQPPAGLPPLHHWWAKVLMFFNLCMAALHLLPLSGLLVGELWLAGSRGDLLRRCIPTQRLWLVITLLAASPLLDLTLGGVMIFPLYEQLSNLAAHLFR